jgi:hypothetical protein
MTKRLPAALAAGVLVTFVYGGGASQRARAAGAYTLEPVAYGMQLKTPDGRVVFEYMTKKPDSVGLTSPSVACFHPVNTPSGERVTALAPDDHPHHRGMYIAWHDAEFRQPLDLSRRTPTSPLYGWNITKVDFWGWGQYAPRDGRVIQNHDLKLASTDATKAEIEVHNDWNVNNRKMADETTTATAAEREGVYVIDVVFRLAVRVDYQLNKQSFSGFNFQARKDGESHYTNAGGVVTLPDAHYSVPELNWPGAPWYGYVVKLASGKTVGAAVLDHPSNPPTTWHGSRGLWMLNPNIAALGPFTIRTGVPLTLRYRVVVHDGDTPIPLVNKLSDEWRAAKF